MHRLLALALVAAFFTGLLLPTTPAAAETFRGVEFPQGAASFADNVVSYQPATDVALSSQVKIPANALGPPDHITGGTPRFVSLGNGGRITVSFVDNALTRSGNTAKDLWIFEIGPAVEDTDVAISQDGVTWIGVGQVAGSTAGIDIDAFVSDPAARFSFVRLTDVRSLDFDTSNTAGADIDSVGAITTVLVDTAPPVVTVPANLTTEATGPEGAAVSFNTSANDGVDGPLTPSCNPASGATFPLGATTVTCSATDAAGNTGGATFSVTVRDTTPPVLNLPASIEAEATGADGALVEYTASASDRVDGEVAVTCEPPSGAQFPLGSNTTACSATDATGNMSEGTFAVEVVDSTAPVIDPHADISMEATGPDGAQVTYDSPATHDAVDGDGLASCLPASASVFPLGVTSVSCSATDSHGNPASGISFTVSVVDTTAPAIAGMPGDLTIVATGPIGATVTWPGPTAGDLVDGSVAVICSPPSGASFPVGATAVACAATDAAGNVSGASFTVTVVYGVCPLFDQSKSVKAGAVKPIHIQLCDAAGGNLSSPDLLLNAVGLRRLDGTASAQVEDPGQSNSPDNNFRYVDGSYVYNLATAGLSRGTWEVQFTVAGDSRIYTVTFDVR
jgi:hypothetical protein